MSEFASRNQRRAVKEHKCWLCSLPIRAKAEYIHIKAFQDGRYREIRIHIHCDAILSEYAEQNELEEIDMTRKADIGEWITETACAVFNHDDCGRRANERYSCKDVLRHIVSPLVLTAALKSVKENE